MNSKKRFSKDPKVKLISIENFFNLSNYLRAALKGELWTNKTCPIRNQIYYKFTSRYLVCLQYRQQIINYGLDIKEKLENINIALRDGKTEYELFDTKLNELYRERTQCKKNKVLDEQIIEIENARKLLPGYKESEEPCIKPFESYLSNTGYKTSKENLKNKYLVFDVETNGTRKSNDDLLSLSIYDPSTGICYNRYFPLDLQPVVLTGFINGIDDELLANATHMTQEELNWLYKYFHLKDRVLLSFSGGQGTFDSSFVQNYCKRQGLFGFDDLHFKNIKSIFPKAPFGVEGQLTKDNLCRVLGIEGVTEDHSSYNDCILEWKLFEKIESNCFFFIEEHLFKYTPNYIIPCTYLIKHPELAIYAKINPSQIYGKATELLRAELPPRLIKKIKKFPTNITGISIENGINSYLHAEKQDNLEFLTRNKSHLEYIGSLNSRIESIPIIIEDDGTIKADNSKDEKYIKEVNSITKIIIDFLKPVVDYLKYNIFKNGKIKTQELSISDDKKVLGLCDLSDCKSVVEIKTFNIMKEDDLIKEEVATQLFYQAKGREPYVLSIVFGKHTNSKGQEIINDLKVLLYKVKLFVDNVPEQNLPELNISSPTNGFDRI